MSLTVACLYRQIERLLFAAASFIVLFCAAGSPSNLLAQNRAVITGQVTDLSGAVVPQATVDVTNSQTGVVIHLQANTEGIYRSPSLSPGPYQIQATARGFETLVRSDVVVHLGDVLEINLQLKVGATTETVTVSGAAPLLNTEDASLGQTVRSQDVKSLPMISRVPTALLLLTPTVRYVGDDPLSFGGSRFNLGGLGNVNVVINGAPAGSDRTNTDQQTSNPSVEAVQEARVQENSFSAEYGEDVGALVLYETKSGGNAYHASLYEYLRNTALDTYNGFNDQKAADRYNVFGGTVGGYIIKNKLFFFASQEGAEERNPSSAVYTVPTAAELQGNFSSVLNSNGTPDVIYNPTTHQAFGGNVIPSGDISSVAQKVSAFFPAPSGPGTVSGANNLLTTQSLVLSKFSSADRIDWTPTAKDAFTATGLIAMSTYNSAQIAGYSKFPFAAPSQLVGTWRTYNLNLGYNHTFTSNLNEHARIVYRQERIHRTEPEYDPNAQFAANLGLTGIPAVLGDQCFPTFSLTGFTEMGYAPCQAESFPETSFNLMSTTGYLHGKHYLKWGVDAFRSTHHRYVATSPNGAYSFDSVGTSETGVPGTGNSVADFLLGWVSSASINSQAISSPFIYREWYNGYFVEDEWRATPRLELTAGLRWDVDFPLTELQNQISGFNPTAINPVSGTPGIITYAGQNGIPRGAYDTDWHRPGPRLGFAYRLTDSLVVRGGYGIYGIDPVLGINAATPSVGTQAVNNSFSVPNDYSAPAFLLDSGLPAFQVGGLATNPGPGFGAVTVGESPILSPTFLNRNWPLGYTQNFNLSIQKQFTHNLLVEVAGQGILGRKLPVSEDFNQIPPSTVNTSGQLVWDTTGNPQIYRPFPQYGSVTDIKTPWGIEDYYALTLRVEKRFARDFSAYGNFAVNKATGLLSTEDDYDRRISWGPVEYNAANAASDIPYWQSTVGIVYNLPFGRGKSYLQSGAGAEILGGWSLSGILRLQGGLPFSLTNGGSPSLNCECPLGARVNAIGNLKGVARSSNEWFNTKAVVAPALGQIGNLGQGVLTSPGIQRFDLHLAKNFPIKDNLQAQLGVECFNCTNTDEYGIPGTTLGTGSFGIISGPLLDGANANDNGVSGARILQLSLRFDF